MDTPTIAAYYRESDPLKRIALLERAVAEGEDTEENAIRKELWEIRYGEAAETGKGARADGFLALWMVLEYNRDAGKKLFGSGRANKEIIKTLNKLRFEEIQNKSDLHRELLYRECVHMVQLYMNLCQKDKNYSSLLLGMISMSDDRVKDKIRADIRETAVKLPAELKLEKELSMITKAACEVFEEFFPEEKLQ